MYVSCNDPSQKAMVLFDRAGEMLETTCFEKNFLDDVEVRKHLLKTYNIEEVGEEPWEY